MRIQEAEAAAAEADAVAAAARARVDRLRRDADAHFKFAEENVADSETHASDADRILAAGVENDADSPRQALADTDTDTDTDTEVDQPADKSETAPRTENTVAAESNSLAGQAWWRRRLPSLSTASAVIAALLIMCFAGAYGYMVWQHRDVIHREQRAARFIAGARQGVVNMTSLDSKKAKEDVQRVINSSTGEFRNEFQDHAKEFAMVIERSKVATEGTVDAAAIDSMQERSASVLVSARSRVSNSAGAKDEPRTWRLRVTVTEDAGDYKMSKVDFVP